MPDFFRRAGARILRVLQSSADPTVVGASAYLYAKLVGTVTQLFTRDSAGVVFQMTPPGIVGGTTISPAAITGTNNNYAPAGLSTATVIRQDLSGPATITGLDATAAGGGSRRVTIFNINATIANQLILANENASSTAGNRFAMPGGADFPLPPNSSVSFEYDPTSSRWRPIGMATTWIPDVVITPTALVANQNNWAPTGLAGATQMRLGYAAGLTITGMVAQPAGTEITIQSIRSTASPEYLTFANESASSTAANRFALPTGAAWYLPPNCSITFKYDGTLSRWVWKSFVSNAFPVFTSNGAPGVSVGYPVENIGLSRNASQILALYASGSRMLIDGASPDPRPATVETNAYFDVKGQARMSGTVAVGPLTGTVNNQAITDITQIARITTSAATALTGLTGGATGRQLTLVNASPTDNVTLNSEDAASTAANRFLLSAATYVIPPNGAVQIWYDPTSLRWRKLS
jgi:hypothetical protein